jgi:Na+/H+ antiporter NhaD/arsenite permease-like protein
MADPMTSEATSGLDNAAQHIPVSDEISLGVTLLFTGILAAMIACLALEEKLHAKKSVIVGLFAIVGLVLGAFMGLLPFGAVTLPDGHQVKVPEFIPAIDWGVITIILGSSIFVDVTSKSGLFTWIAIRLTKTSKGDPLMLLIYYGVMTVVFSAVLNNVTAMIIVGSLSAVSLDKLERNDKLLGFLLIEGLLTNVGGLLTLISSVPNIIVGTTAGISFVTFFIKASPYVVVATAATLFMGAKLFGIQRLAPHERGQAMSQVEEFDENDGIDSVGFFWFGVLMLVLFIVFIASASFEGWAIGKLGMGFVAMAFAMIMLIRYKAEAHTFYSAVDWDLILFFAFLFVVIHVMEEAGVLHLMGKGFAPIIDLGEVVGGGLLLVVAAIASSVTDNIPLAAMLAKILAAPAFAVPADSPLWWSVIFGANLGGNLTPIGSASTLVAVTIMHKHQVGVSFARFVVMAFPYALLHIFLAVVYVLMVLG